MMSRLPLSFMLKIIAVSFFISTKCLYFQQCKWMEGLKNSTRRFYDKDGNEKSLEELIYAHKGSIEFDLIYEEDGKRDALTFYRHRIFQPKTNDFIERKMEMLKSLNSDPGFIEFMGCKNNYLSKKETKSIDDKIEIPDIPSLILMFKKAYSNLSEESGPNPSLNKLRNKSLIVRLQHYRYLAQRLRILHNKNIIYGNMQESTVIVPEENFSNLILGYSEYMGQENEYMGLGATHRFKLTKIGDIQALGKTIEYFEGIAVPPPIDFPTSDPELSPAEKKKIYETYEQKCNDPLYKKFGEVLQRCIYDTTHEFLIDEVIEAFDTLINNAENPMAIPSMDMSYSYPHLVLDFASVNKLKNPLRQYKQKGLLPKNELKIFKIFRNTLPKYYDIEKVELNNEHINLQMKHQKNGVGDNGLAKLFDDQESAANSYLSNDSLSINLSSKNSKEIDEGDNIEGRAKEAGVYNNNKLLTMPGQQANKPLHISIYWIISALFFGLIAVPAYLLKSRSE